MQLVLIQNMMQQCRFHEELEILRYLMLVQQSESSAHLSRWTDFLIGWKKSDPRQRDSRFCASYTMLGSPLNIPRWLEDNSHLLKPPIGNYCAYDKEMTVMIVGGPNQRQDFHINETPEWFYMYRGGMVLKVMDDGSPRDIPIEEGEMFLLPPNTPHSPQRRKDTIGLVIELPRPSESKDTLQWYCDNPVCTEIVYRASFHMSDLGTQVKNGVEDFWASKENRTCPKCGTIKERI